MPTLLSTLFVSSAASQWKTTAISRGIHRGFRLSTSPEDLSVTVVSDPTVGDHLAVYRTADGYDLTIQAYEDFRVRLTSLVNTTVVLALSATTQTSGDSIAYLQAYELSPVDEFTTAFDRNLLIVLGTVVVPALGVIDTFDIEDTYRVPSWAEINTQNISLQPFIQDPTFELVGVVGSDIGTPIFWHPGGAGTLVNASWKVAAGVKSGTKEIRLVSAAGGNGAGELHCYGSGNIKEGGTIRLRMWLKRLLQTATISVQGRGLTVTGTGGSSVLAWAENPTAVDSDYRLVDFSAKVPVNTPKTCVLGDVYITISFTVGGVGVPVFAIDSIQVSYEPELDLLTTPPSNTSVFNPLGLVFSNPLGEQNLALTHLEMDPTNPSPAGVLVGSNGKGALALSFDNPVLKWLGSLILGQGQKFSAAAMAEARLTIPGSTGSRVLLMEFPDTSVTPVYTRVYVFGSKLEVVSGTKWDATGAVWNTDEIGAYKTLVRWGDESIAFYSQDPGVGGASFADAAWILRYRVSTSYIDSGGSLIEALDGRLQVSAGTHSNPAANVYVKNTLYAKNMPKAWGLITTGAGVPVLTEGFNVASVAYGALNGSVLVVLQESFAAIVGQDQYVVNATVQSGSVASCAGIASKAPGQFEVVYTEQNGGTQVFEKIDLSGSTVKLGFVVYGLYS